MVTKTVTFCNHITWFFFFFIFSPEPTVCATTDILSKRVIHVHCIVESDKFIKINTKKKEENSMGQAITCFISQNQFALSTVIASTEGIFSSNSECVVCIRFQPWNHGLTVLNNASLRHWRLVTCCIFPCERIITKLNWIVCWRLCTGCIPCQKNTAGW